MQLPRLVCVGDVEPFLPAVLRGLELLQVEVLDVPAGLDPEAANGVHSARPGVALHVEDVLPQAPVRVYAQEALAKNDEARDVQNGVGSEVMELNAIGYIKPRRNS